MNAIGLGLSLAILCKLAASMVLPASKDAGFEVSSGDSCFEVFRLLEDSEVSSHGFAFEGNEEEPSRIEASSRKAVPLLASNDPAPPVADGDESSRRSPSTPEPEVDAESSVSVERTEDRETTASGGEVSEEARPLVDKVQSFYENTNDFTASFEQTYTYQVGRQVKSSGTVAFKKPAMMRWDYENPRERSFVVDGSDLWIWTPEDFSVVRQQGFTASDLSTSITFLWGEGRLENEFHIAMDGDDRLSLSPVRPEGAFRQLVFKVDTETGQVLESTIIDPQGNGNHMVFSNVKQNTGLGRDRFAFSPPEGADLQEMPSFR